MRKLKSMVRFIRQPWQSLLLISAVFLLVAFVEPSPAAISGQEVLILNAYHAGYSWTDDMTNGIRETLRKGGYQADPMVEYMDWKRFPFKENLDEIYRVYLYKYAKRKLSVVFVTDNAALEFVLRYRDEIFSGARVVFCGINGYSEKMLAGQKDITGVVEDVDPTGTLDVALKLHPDAKEVLIVFDGTESGQAARNNVARKVLQYGNRVRFRFLDNPLVNEIEAALRELPPGSFALQGTYSRDRNGRTYNIDEVVKLIAPNSPVPIYGLWEAMCGKGIVGGSLLSGRIQGETAGKLGLRILAGEPVSSIPVIEKTPMIMMFDYRQMERYGVNTDLLPAGSSVINRPFSFYATYKLTIWIVALVICLLAGTVAVLLVNMAARRRAEKDLLREKRYIEQIISVAPTMICTFAKDGRILSQNRAVATISGYSSEELTARDWWQIFSEDEQQREQLQHDLKDGPVLNLEMGLTTSAGEKRIISWNLVSRFDENAAALEIIGIGIDMTERKQAEEEREQFLRELESMNGELESIVYVASHDLRSPLVNIQGFSRKLGKACDDISLLLKSMHLPEEQRLALDRILLETVPKSMHFITGSVEKMDTLLGGLLRLSRLGRKALDMKPLDMDRLIEEVVASMAYQLQKYGGAIECQQLHPCIGDLVQVNQIFSNLIDNAIKYRAPEQALLIKISSRKEGANVIFCVKDNGIGIPAAQQHKIWEIFHRLNPESEAEGEGLGLTMVRRILDRCNGKVWVESAPGHGSSFFVSLPSGGNSAVLRTTRPL